MKYALILLGLGLAACHSPAPGLSAETLRQRADSLALAGAPGVALRYLEAAADQGDLEAFARLAAAHDRGYLRIPTDPNSPHGTQHVAIWSFPWQAGRWRSAYEQARDEQAREGDHTALLRLADDLAVPSLWLRRPDALPDPDSARAIRQRLIREGSGPAMVHEALRLHSNGDRDGADALLVRAAEAGQPQACELRVAFRTQPGLPSRDDASAQAAATLIDALEACPSRRSESGGTRIVAGLKRGQRSGATQAGAQLDSLRALGVFERHPHLADA